MTTSDPQFSEFWEPGIRLFVSECDQVILTEPIRSFILEARHDGQRPVLLTNASTHIGWFVADELRNAGGRWVVQDPEGRDHDATTGVSISGMADLWQDLSPDRPRLSSFERGQDQPGLGTFFFEVFSRERARNSTRCGKVAEHMVSRLGGGRLIRWDECEPLATPWDLTAITTSLQQQMPLTRRHLGRSNRGAMVSIAVARTNQGLLEHTRGLLPTGPYGQPIGLPDGASLAMHPAITETLMELGTRFRPNIAIISYGEAEERDGSLGQLAIQRHGEVPLAALIGPPAVRDLRIDMEEISRTHDVTPVGLKKAPSMLVRFSRGDDFWHQMISFIHALDQERLATALGGTPVDHPEKEHH